MQLLDNPIQEYAWGSHTVLARFLDRPAPTEAPQAELWIGAHPAAPSRLASGESLGSFIAADPEAANREVRSAADTLMLAFMRGLQVGAAAR